MPSKTRAQLIEENEILWRDNERLVNRLRLDVEDEEDDEEDDEDDEDEEYDEDDE